jgi:trimethylamine---corrinoid protein Co-methyltransferase
MSPVTVAGTLTQILAEAWPAWPSPSSCRPGAPVVFGTVRQLDLDAVGRAHLRHARALPMCWLRRGPARPPPRRAVPLRRLADRLEAARCPGRARERQHPVADAARRRELRAAFGRLARGRAGVGLREVHASMPTSSPCSRPFSKALDLSPRRPGARRHPRGRAGQATFSAAPIPRPISRTPSGARASPTTTPSSSGATPAASTRRTARQRHLETATCATMKPRPLDESLDEALNDFMARRKEVLPDSVS